MYSVVALLRGSTKYFTKKKSLYFKGMISIFKSRMTHVYTNLYVIKAFFFCTIYASISKKLNFEITRTWHQLGIPRSVLKSEELFFFLV